MTNHPINAVLELSPEDMRTLGYLVIDMLVDHVSTLHDQPAIRTASRQVMEARLRQPLPELGMDPRDVLAQVRRDVFGEICHRDHPRDFGFVPSPSNFVSVMADTLASGLNIFSGAWSESAGAAVLELVVIDWFRQLFGLPPEAGGLFVSGGTMANLTGLAVARHVKLHDKVEKARVYFSDQTHVASLRSLKLLGFQPEQLCSLRSDDAYRLSVSDLAQQIAADRDLGYQPFCIIASAGTVSTGAIDPLDQLAELCRREDIWLHVDGAYGASAILSDQGRRLLAGLKEADSIVFDPHKWLFQPYEIGGVLVRDRRQLKQTFATHAEYLDDAANLADEEINFFDHGIQLTRGFRALKVWMSLKTFGREAFQQAQNRGFALAELAEQVLRESPHWEIMTPPQMGIVTFRYRRVGQSDDVIDAVNHQIARQMMADGFARLITTTLIGRHLDEKSGSLQGKTALRLCTINPRTTDDDIRQTIDKLEQFGNQASQ
jgi:aromatic-L-amino-acid/L-tryptophan decarboxylase